MFEDAKINQYSTDCTWSTDSTKINRPGHNMVRHKYVLNEYLTADCSCTTKCFWKNSYRSLYSTSLRFFLHLLRPNWAIIRGTVSLWSMFENQQMSSISEFFRMFKNTHCFANNWSIWTQKGAKSPKWSVKVWTTVFIQIFFLYFVVHERSAVKSSFTTYVYFDWICMCSVICCLVHLLKALFHWAWFLRKGGCHESALWIENLIVIDKV